MNWLRHGWTLAHGFKSPRRCEVMSALTRTTKVLLAVLFVMVLLANFARELLVVLEQEDNSTFYISPGSIVSAIIIAIAAVALWVWYKKQRLLPVSFKSLYLFILIAVFEAAGAAALAALIIKRGFASWYVIVVLAMAWGLFIIADVLRSEAKNN